MECSIAALIACFSWSNLYVDTGLSYQDAGIYQSYEEFNSERTVIDGLETNSGWTDAKWQAHKAENPYGRLVLGYEINLKPITWRIEASHTSSLAGTHDRGINSVTVSARWFPFRR
jgi:hypothetical protein